ncbi:hypothetical protein OEZ86_014373 [Tetradesmus obliquus]|nr:hypothetical protein OEZ86_014373 [Tetradesmus obliquus]
MPQLSGCRLTKIRAAPPNFMQAPGGISCREHRNRSGSRCFKFAVPTLLAAAFGCAWQQPGFKVQLSVHKDGTCIAGGPGESLQCCLFFATSAVYTRPQALRGSYQAAT